MSVVNDLIRIAKAMERDARRREQLKVRAEKEWERENQRRQKAREKAAREAERKRKSELAREKALHIQQSKDEARRRTEQVQAEISQLGGLLVSAIGKSHVPDLSALKLAFPTAEPAPPRFRANPPRPDALEVPAKPESPRLPPEPSFSDSTYRDTLGLFKTAKKKAAAQAAFEQDHSEWKNKVGQIERQHARALHEWEQEKASVESEQARQEAEWRKAVEDIAKRNGELAERHRQAVKSWEVDKESFEQSVEQLGDAYVRGEPDAVSMYVEIALGQSEYPPAFPVDVKANFNQENGELIIDRTLPSPELMPKVKEVAYVQSRDEFVEKPIAKTHAAERYDNVIYQGALRTVLEAFSADTSKHVKAIVFNGWVEGTDPATGKAAKPCIASLHVTRDEFSELDLELVDPKACFKKLKGVAASKLATLVPIQPLARFNKDDERFVEGRDIAGELDQGTNLAAMDWEDFEHLIRGLFEEEFGQAGSEVKITRASRDRGVDAIAFDPDPIRGGKFVIQAKRYTRTVGVDAVRDLYGTVINEGANKGILVTTAEYGPDAYDFVKDKPLTLVTGGELLYLLEKHGHKARIDLAEARRLNAEAA